MHADRKMLIVDTKLAMRIPLQTEAPFCAGQAGEVGGLATQHVSRTAGSAWTAALCSI